MVQINNSRKIALWGTGLEAVRFMYSTDLDIDVVIDNNRVSEDWTFRGLPVKKTTELSNLKEYYIVMATSEGVYVQICEGLLSQGLEEFIDFCYCRHIGKKLAVLHGNCHVDVMKSFLGSSQKFNEEYAIYPLPSIYGIREGYIRGEILEHCDLFIHQDIRPDNSCGYKLSDEYVLPQVNVAAHKITVPNLFGYGSMFFPQVIGNPNNSWLFSGRDRNGMFPHGNKVIEKALEEGKSVEDIVRLLESACISEDEIIENFAEEVSKMQKREENWDIKISRFILENYKDVQIFYSCWHPTNIVIKEIVLQILMKLGITDENIETELKMDTHEEPLLSCVRETLGIQWKKEHIREGSACKRINNKMTLEEYVREYVWWCHGEEKDKNVL